MADYATITLYLLGCVSKKFNCTLLAEGKVQRDSVDSSHPKSLKKVTQNVTAVSIYLGVVKLLIKEPLLASDDILQKGLGEIK